MTRKCLRWVICIIGILEIRIIFRYDNFSYPSFPPVQIWYEWRDCVDSAGTQCCWAGSGVHPVQEGE